MKLLRTILIAVITAKVRGKKPELPLCPTNIQFFPQNLPMHCKMPAGVSVTMPPFPPYFPNPPSDSESDSMPFPLPPGMPPPGMLPGLPPGMPPPGMLPGLPPPGMPPPGIPVPGPMGMPMPMPGAAPPHKLPVIVMPFYSPDPSFKKHHGPHGELREKHGRLAVYPRRPPFHNHHSDDSSDTDTSSDFSSDTSSEHRSWWKGHRGYRRSGKRADKKHSRRHKHAHKKERLLTPILQYVTKDGYVIYEKKITKNEATDWLGTKKENDGDENEQQISENADTPNDNMEAAEPEVNTDVEILDARKDKEPVEAPAPAPKGPGRSHHARKIKPSKLHRAKEEDKTKESPT